MRLLPRIDASGWGGATLTDPAARDEEARGHCFAIQWLGLIVEIGVGRIHRLAPRRHAPMTDICQSCGAKAELDGGSECARCTAL